MTPKTEAQARHADRERNVILNTAVRDLDKIINCHNPDFDVPINDGVWDYLDKMGVDLVGLATRTKRITDNDA
jgi:hypothetical protein